MAKDRSLRLSGALSQNLSKISLTLEEECPEAGRLVLYCDYDKTQNTADRMKEKFTRTNTHTKTWNAGQGKYRSAILRAGTGSNASVGQVIVSETYTIAFEGNLDNPHVTFSLPEQKPLYWKEAQTISAPALAVFMMEESLLRWSRPGGGRLPKRQRNSGRLDRIRCFPQKHAQRTIVFMRTMT